MRKKVGLRKSGGRNNRGRITVRGRGGGHKRLYREMTWGSWYGKVKVKRKEEDPNRTGEIMWCERGKEKYYILVNEEEEGKWLEGQRIERRGGEEEGEEGSEAYRRAIGGLEGKRRVSRLRVESEKKKGKYYEIGKAAGTSSKVLKQRGEETLVEYPSGERKWKKGESLGRLGEISKKKVKREKGKAGSRRRLGRKPKVRGVARNAIDHYMGGKGKGGGHRGLSKWGKLGKRKKCKGM